MIKFVSKGFLPLWLMLVITIALAATAILVLPHPSPKASEGTARNPNLPPLPTRQVSSSPLLPEEGLGEVGVSLSAGLGTVADTANWKTYRNEEYGFEVKYPNNLLLDEYINPSSSDLQVFFGSKNTENYFQVQVKKNLDVMLEKYYYLDFNYSSESTLDGKRALVYKAPEGYCDGPGCGSPFLAYVARNGKDFYHLVFYGDVGLSEAENKILSTFRFLES